jgi:hypothetical protein
MADSMGCLVGLAGTSFANHRRAMPAVSAFSIAEDDG